MAGGIGEGEFKRYIAEATGAFFLTMGGMLSIIGGGDLISVAAAHGLILAMMVYFIGPVSGGHCNPAVSICLWAQKKLDNRSLAGYVSFQIVGATIGALIAVAVIPLVPWGTTAQRGATLGLLTSNTASGYFSPGGAFVLEMFMTMLLGIMVSVVVAGGERMNSISGALIGGTLFACICWGGPLTGGSLNPARSLGPAFVSGTNQVVWASIWVYLFAPIVGGFLAAGAFMWFKGDLKIHFASASSSNALPPPPPGTGLPAAPPPPPPLPAPPVMVGEPPKPPS